MHQSTEKRLIFSFLQKKVSRKVLAYHVHACFSHKQAELPLGWLQKGANAQDHLSSAQLTQPRAGATASGRRPAQSRAPAIPVVCSTPVVLPAFMSGTGDGKRFLSARSSGALSRSCDWSRGRHHQKWWCRSWRVARPRRRWTRPAT